MRLHIDGETFSATPIKRGLIQYFQDPQYELLMLAWAIDHEPVHLWAKAEGEMMDNRLYQALQNESVEIHAFNARFEWHILKKLGFAINYARMHCTMIRAYSLSFAGSLEEVQRQIGTPQEKKKLQAGKKLIQRFCKPAPKSHKTRRYTQDTHPEEWDLFKRYCKQDVVAERELDLWCSQYPSEPPAEREYEIIDHMINMRGLPIDSELVDAAIDVDRQYRRNLMVQLRDITGLLNPGSNRQFLAWLQETYPDIENVQKGTLNNLVETTEDGSPVHEACKLKLEYSKTSNAKWKAVQDSIFDENRLVYASRFAGIQRTKQWAADSPALADNGEELQIPSRIVDLRNVFQFAGAQRTKRWAGRIVQPHNLPSSMFDDPEEYAAAVETILYRNPDLIELVWGSPSALLSQSIRGAITAPAGKLLAVSDFSSIESRVLGWLADCQRVNFLFENNLDTYKDFAKELFHVPYDQVTKAQRKFAKPPVLGCGYMLGAKGLTAYAEGYGVKMSEEESQYAVDLFRRVYPEIKTLWENYVDMIQTALRKPGFWYAAGKVQAGVYRSMLLIRLPSGRYLHYYQPKWEEVIAPWSKPERPQTVWSFTYMGKSQYTMQWERINSHAGKITENIDQAISRDILAEAMKAAFVDALDIRGHVHDELICLSEKDRAQEDLDRLKVIMSRPPKWAPDLLLSAEGWVGERYRKD